MASPTLTPQYRIFLNVTASQLQERLNVLMAELQRESDRGMALIAAAALDELLKDILVHYFIKSSISTEILSTFGKDISNRAKLAYVLGLIHKSEYQSIILMIEIRNKFAHIASTELNFDTPLIADVCEKLFENSALQQMILPQVLITQPSPQSPSNRLIYQSRFWEFYWMMGMRKFEIVRSEPIKLLGKIVKDVSELRAKSAPKKDWDEEDKN